ncbi:MULTISPECIES: NAD(P)H dehydrogenase [unclassified Clostridium]|uniref:NAD(P)H dehydrogenase n=1 Tax=unclassified Clostridium TaxID=2614128 RepID=UPI0025BD4532|nr:MULTISPECIES: NAD(P)H dehydrogenase [unclassified Clostridium]
MNTIIINGSPKGKNGNSEIFIKQFIKEMKFPYEVKYICSENPKSLAKYVESFENIILVLPLYIHSMPGITMRFINYLEPAKHSEKKSIGFILQCGFMETAQCKYAEAYFRSLSIELNRTYLGTVTKGESAGTYVKPDFLNKKLFNMLSDLGRIYEETNRFDSEIVEKMKIPYELTGFKLKSLQFITNIGLGDIWWNKMLKQNNVFDKRFDRPFI